MGNSHSGFDAFNWLKQLVSACGAFWCVRMHRQISTPMYGRYRCLHCNREYAINWEQPDPLYAPGGVATLRRQVRPEGTRLALPDPRTAGSAHRP